MRSKTIKLASVLLPIFFCVPVSSAAMSAEIKSDDINPIVINISSDTTLLPPASEQDLLVLPTRVPIASTKDGFFVDDQQIDKSGVTTVVSLHPDVPIDFSKSVNIRIPVALADNTSVKIISSDDIEHWKTLIETTVTEGSVMFDTPRLNFVAIYKTPESSDTTSFTDIRGHWAETSILQLKNFGIVKGKSDTLFAPDDAVSRAEFIKMVILAFHPGIAPITATSFDDVSMQDWFAPYVEEAVRDGILDHNIFFNPNQSIARAEAIKILILASGNHPEDLDIDTFSDVQPTDWFRPYVVFMRARNLIAGYPDGTFRPNQSMTRAEAARIMMTFINGFNE